MMRREFVAARIGRAALLSLLVASAIPAGVQASVPSIWGWVTARQPTTASYTPAAKDQGSSVGATNTVQRLGVGHYVVSLPNLKPTTTCPAAPHYNGCSGTPVVSAMSGSLHTCDVGDLGSGDPVLIDVNCYDHNGHLADSMFTALFLAPRDNHGTVAYLYADHPS